jgi:type IV secretion system protein TrbL
VVKRTLCIGVAVAVLLVGAVPARAAPATAWAQFPDQVVQQFTTLAAGWVGQFQAYAFGTFGTLAVLHLAWCGFKLAFRGAAAEEILAELVNVIFFLGIGAFALGNGPALLGDVVNSFRVAGQNVGGVGLAPSQILGAGLQIAGQAWQQMSLWHPGASAGLTMVALVVILSIAFIAACMTIALVQAAFYIPVATFFLAFMGSGWTRDLAISMARQAFALGVKLLALELLTGAALGFIRNMLTVLTDFSGFNAGVVIASVFVLAMLTKVLPDWLAGIVGGAAIGEGAAITGAAAAAAGAGAGAAVGAVGGAAMVGSAARLASTQMAASAAEAAAGGGTVGPQTRIGAAATLLGKTVQNAGAATAADIGRRLSGQGSRHGSAPWRVAADLGNQHRLLAGDAAKPAPPAPAGNTIGPAP